MAITKTEAESAWADYDDEDGKKLRAVALRNLDTIDVNVTADPADALGKLALAAGEASTLVRGEAIVELLTDLRSELRQIRMHMAEMTGETFTPPEYE